MARILLIDDDDLVRESVRTHLNFAGHEVTATAHGGEGLRAFRSCAAFDLVITDIFMPEMDGIETVIGLRRHGCTVPIIVTTGGPMMLRNHHVDAKTDYLHIASVLGATHTLRKPFSARQILALVDECLNAAGSDAAGGRAGTGGDKGGQDNGPS